MVILNPLEPWPGELVLPAAERHGVKLITRVVDYGGLFHDDVLPGPRVPARATTARFRPAGWIEAGRERLERMRPIAERHGLTTLQLACAVEPRARAGALRRADADPGARRRRAADRGQARRAGRACPRRRR